MRTFGTVIAVIAALVWSALVWGAYGLISLSADFVANNANDLGVSNGATAFSNWLVALVRDYGTGTTAAIWALGLLAILLLRAVYNWLVVMMTAEGRDGFHESSPIPSAPVESRRVDILPPPEPQQKSSRWGRNP